ncbi:DNA polymerase alpha/epsilon subunit B-domain-containing protein [Ilyonectria robusta]|uniref:DNA polymerase alpha/epsilon subunit B-domain-containing protein n=1 Tax=Ilyonectria robusta TaxID=1079257 RepID=UPI001E8CB35C|nr:DNA polymerase alpha/epsilon subunit B-domain-containing protein [Ilyonectria robusta]KAH8699835.1 DNA polymerase alpha/epsilon subunit B-domain-containing protein [Ilyonectria robusta]
MDQTPAPIFRRQRPLIPSSSAAIPSSSPAFGTPVHPLRPFAVNAPKAAILPIILPPATLRPLAFRTFTKKHSLTLTSSALQELAAFIGRHCGSGWREEGLAERVLEEIARSWKNRNGGVIVEGSSKELQEIIKTLEGNMSGGKITGPGRGLPRGDSMLDIKDGDVMNTRLGIRPALLTREDSNTSFGMSGLGVQEETEDEEKHNDPRAWLKVIDAYEQPRLIYNVGKKHFERETSAPSLLPPASHKTTVYRNRYNVIHQRLLRNESFQTSAVASSRKRTLQRSLSTQQSLKLTPIANLLGRHGSNHMLLGQLVILPTGDLAISDLTGTIALDLAQAVAIPSDSAWFCPGMIVLVDGVYEEEDESIGRGLSGSSGVGGTLGGRFQGFYIGQPPCEKRKETLGISGGDGGHEQTIGGGFGWIDFLGVGSERAVGAKMRRLENRLLAPSQDDDVPSRNRIVILGELNLDQPRTMQALRKILALYAAEPEGSSPLTFVLTGNFTQQAVMARGGSGGSIEYKEYFDALASTLSDFPTLLQSSTFVFVPGDNDGWVSAFTAGASVPLPRKPVPDMFTSRIRRAFATANAEAGGKSDGAAIWTSNPGRLTLFGPNHELVLFRDDLSARLSRTSVRLKHTAADPEPSEEAPTQQPNSPEETPASEPMDVDADAPEQTTASSSTTLPQDLHTAHKLVKTILDQGYLAPFRQSIRPVHWDYASALHLYPLPTAMVLVDTTAPPFCVTYEGCHVMNPGSVLVPGRKGVGRWVEYEVGGTGKLRECAF